MDNWEPSKGRIEIEYRIICGNCGYWEYMDGGNMREMKRWVKSLGWVKLDTLSWVCPNCVKMFIAQQKEWEESNSKDVEEVVQ